MRLRGFGGSLLGHYLQAHVRGKPRRTIHALLGDLEVGVCGLEDVRDILLRIAVVEREPGALHLHHDLVPLAEAVMAPMQIDSVFIDFVRSDRLRFLEALAKTSTDRLAADK